MSHSGATIHSPATAKRRRDAATRVMRGMQRLMDCLTPDEVEALASRIEEALTPPPAPGTDPFVEAVSGGRMPSEPERLVLAISSALKDFEFAARVESRRRLVQNKQLSVAKIGPGERHLLPLPAGKLDSSLKATSEHLIVAGGQLADGLFG